MEHSVNLVLTMLLAGLWHGAGWTFVAWGCLHGGLLVVHRLWQKSTFRSERPGAAVYRFGSILLTLISVMAGWVLFRSASIADAWEMYRGLVGFNGITAAGVFVARFDAVFWIVFAVAVLAVVGEGRTMRWLPAVPVRRLLLLVGFVGAVLELGGQEYNPFLYFQF